MMMFIAPGQIWPMSALQSAELDYSYGGFHLYMLLGMRLFSHAPDMAQQRLYERMSHHVYMRRRLAGLVW